MRSSNGPRPVLVRSLSGPRAVLVRSSSGRPVRRPSQPAGGLAAIPGVAIRDAPDAFNAEAAAAAGAGRCAIVAFEAATALGVDAQAIKATLGFGPLGGE